MKRFFALLVITCFVLPLFAGCTQDAPEESTKEETTLEPSDETTAPAEETTAEVIEEVKSDFEIYQSNSITPSACNYALKSTDGQPVHRTFRGVYKIQQFGELEYKFYFSNNVDSTFSNGSHSYRAMPTESYKIISAKVGTSSKMTGMGDMNAPKTLTFDGNEGRDVAAQEMFWSDPITLNIPDGHYLIFEWQVEYTVIAATNSEDSVCFLYDDSRGRLIVATSAPMPALIGAKRENALRVAFIGDSITMGIGAGTRNHKFWAAQIAELAGTEISFWNLGLGYARADDAANSPSWLEKAKNNDVIVICFGVNDINSGPYHFTGQRSADQIIADINTIATTCKEAGCEIILFSTPPYTYSNSTKIEVWRELTEKIKALAETSGYDFFDFAAILGSESNPATPAYGGHPNEAGCKAVADAFMASGLLEKYLNK